MSPSATKRPDAPAGLRHLALRVRNIEACERFYTALLGLRVEWRPDPDNLYLTGGSDNLALHRVREAPAADAAQRLDHLGFLLSRPEQVDEWCAFLKGQRVPIVREPRTHRDGARSFYCLDPDGNRVQLLYHPPIASAPAP